MRAHPESADVLLDAVPSGLRAAVRSCARGELPPNVALVHLFMAARSESQAKLVLEAALERYEREDAGAADSLRRALSLWDETPGAFATVNRILQSVERGAAEAPQHGLVRLAHAFDRAAKVSADAGVALYSLGRSDLLQRATEEILACMQAWHLLQSGCIVLDLGCGSGRVLQALAPHARLAVGVDISQGMLRAARERCTDHPNVCVMCSSGSDLALLRDACVDLVLAVDTFPYLVECGLAARYLHEAARLLKRGGHLLIFNYSYRGRPDSDRGDIAGFAEQAGFIMVRNGTRDCVWWDGVTFLLQKRP